MYQLEKPETFEQSIKKSRFLANALPVASEVQAKEAIAALSHADATHNCWAWRIGQAYRFSDDGEPSGTAGKPILAAIDGRELDHVVVIVTRWFGGILLGSGGLIRAYGGTAAACLRQAEIREVRPKVSAALSLGFGDLALVKSRLAANPEIVVINEQFTAEGADLEILLPKGECRTILNQITDLTAGRARMSLEDDAS